MRRAVLIRFLCLPVVLVALAACGGESAPPEPDLRPALGEKLAAHADAIAQRLDAGEACAAKERAVALEREVAAAIEAGRIPAELRRELRRTAARVVAQIECVAAEPPPKEAEEAEEGDGGDDASACDELESRKAAIDAEKEELKEQIEDEEERKEREKELEEDKKAIEEELKECREGN